MHPDIDTEQDRVIFIKSVAEFMVTTFLKQSSTFIIAINFVTVHIVRKY